MAPATHLVVTPDHHSQGRTGRLAVVDDGARPVMPAFACALGRGGVTLAKQEGDGATPVGTFVLRRCYYRPDRGAPPVSDLPVIPITESDGWGDDPGEPVGYNRRIDLPYAFSHENLWRQDGLYDVILVPGHNDDPPIPGKGSAIFVHVAAPDFTPTAGCVALDQGDLRRILTLCGPDTTLTVRPLES